MRLMLLLVTFAWGASIDDVPEPHRDAWTQVAASTAPEDQALLTAALADPALLAAGPEGARAALADESQLLGSLRAVLKTLPQLPDTTVSAWERACRSPEPEVRSWVRAGLADPAVLVEGVVPNPATALLLEEALTEFLGEDEQADAWRAEARSPSPIQRRIVRAAAEHPTWLVKSPEEVLQLVYPPADETAEKAAASRLATVTAALDGQLVWQTSIRKAWRKAARSSGVGDIANVEAALADTTRFLRLPGVEAPPHVAEVAAPTELGGLPLARESGMVEAVLENGLRVTIVGDVALGLSAVVHAVDVGNAHLPEAGLAHLVEHLMFGGAPGFIVRVEDLGGDANAFTNTDETTYVSSVPGAQLLALLDVEAARFSALPTDDDAVRREVDVVLDESRLRGGNSAAGEALRRALLTEHPYAAPVAGDLSTLSGVTAARVREVYTAAYGAKNVHLVIVGPHEPRAVLAEVERRYAAMPSGQALPAVPALALKGSRVARADVGGSNTVYAGVAWRLPPARICPVGDDESQAPCSPQFWADQVALELLSTAGTTRLTEEVVRQSRAWTPVRVWTWRGTSGGYVAVMAEHRPEGLVALSNVGAITLDLFQTVGAVLAVFGGVVIIPAYVPVQANPSAARVHKVLVEGDGDWITDEEIERARRQVLVSELSGYWDATTRAMSIAERARLGAAVDESAMRSIAELDVRAVRTRFHVLFAGARATRLHVR